MDECVALSILSEAEWNVCDDEVVQVGVGVDLGAGIDKIHTKGWTPGSGLAALLGCGTFPTIVPIIL